MKVCALILKDLKILLRDRGTLAGMILQPIILIAVLGMALSSMFGPAVYMPAFDVGIVDHDPGMYSDIFMNQVLGSERIAAIIKPVPMTEEAARAEIEKGKLRAAIVIPSHFSRDIAAGLQASMEVLKDPASMAAAPIVEAITASFAQQVSAHRAGLASVLGQWMDHGVVSPAEAGMAYAEAAERLALMLSSLHPLVEEKSLSTRPVPTAFQYYSAGMGLMFLLFGTLMGARSLLDERDQHTLSRLLTTPTPKATILTGKVAKIFVAGSLQWIALVVITRLLFGVRWGQNIPALIALSAATILAAGGMGVFLSTLSTDRRGLMAAGAVIIQLSSILGGSAIPIYIFPDFIKPISKFTINWWAMHGYTALFQGMGLSEIVTPILALLGIGIVLFTVGAWRLRAA